MRFNVLGPPRRPQFNAPATAPHGTAWWCIALFSTRAAPHGAARRRTVPRRAFVVGKCRAARRGAAARHDRGSPATRTRNAQPKLEAGWSRTAPHRRHTARSRTPDLHNAVLVRWADKHNEPVRLPNLRRAAETLGQPGTRRAFERTASSRCGQQPTAGRRALARLTVLPSSACQCALLLPSIPDPRGVAPATADARRAGLSSV